MKRIRNTAVALLALGSLSLFANARQAAPVLFVSFHFVQRVMISIQ